MPGNWSWGTASPVSSPSPPLHPPPPPAPHPPPQPPVLCLTQSLLLTSLTPLETPPRHRYLKRDSLRCIHHHQHNHHHDYDDHDHHNHDHYTLIRIRLVPPSHDDCPCCSLLLLPLAPDIHRDDHHHDHHDHDGDDDDEDHEDDDDRASFLSTSFLTSNGTYEAIRNTLVWCQRMQICVI